MAQPAADYNAVLEFIDHAKRECFIPTRSMPEPIFDPGYLGMRLAGRPHKDAPGMGQTVQIFASGWMKLEGVMIIAPEEVFDADVRVVLAAANERALRDLLLSFPAGKTGFFYLSGEWMLPTMAEILDGRPLPAREGYCTSAEAFQPKCAYPSRRLELGDYPLVRSHWSEDVWRELMDGGYAVHACEVGGELCALCFHWEVARGRREVHGLQAVRDYSHPYAESVLSSATAEVVAQGQIATCTANLADAEYLPAYRNVGYECFYRIGSYRGAKKGSPYRDVPNHVLFGNPVVSRETSPAAPDEGRAIRGGKDPVLSRFADLSHLGGRKERGQFLAEGITLVERAISDGLPIDGIVYTPTLLREPEGAALIHAARTAGIAHYGASDGLMAKVTTTRPVPSVVAAVCATLRDAMSFRTSSGTILLIAENVANPNNLGLVLRTADAAGVEAVIVSGAGCDPFHKNCVRAARGAVGRIPILGCDHLCDYIDTIKKRGLTVIGAGLGAPQKLYDCRLQVPLAIAVGNEQAGLSRSCLEACDLRVEIPMAPGQDSLNVAVAAGLMLYEVVRQRSWSRH